MALTINDAEKASFRSALFGYNKRDVENFRGEVVETLQQYVDELSALKKEIQMLTEEIEGFRAKEDLVKESVILAQKSHDEIVANAQRRADNIIKEAELKALEIKRELSELSSEKERFEYEFYGLLRGFMERLTARNPALAGGKQFGETFEPASQTGTAPQTKTESHQVEELEALSQKDEDKSPKEAESKSIFPEEPLT